MTTLTLIGLVVLGLFVGGVTGITGASGVLIIVPVLTTFFDEIPLQVILGTSLVVDVIASISVSYAYARTKHLDVKGSLWLLIGALLGAQVGSFFVIDFSKVLIELVLTIAMVFFGMRMWKSGSSKGNHKAFVLPESLAVYVRTPIGMILSGFVIGLITGIFGAGGGLAIFIVLYSFLKFPIKTAIGTSSFIMLLTALSGVFGYVKNFNLDITMGLVIGVSAALGGALSSMYANKIKEETLARIIGVFFVFLAILMFVFKVLFPLLSID